MAILLQRLITPAPSLCALRSESPLFALQTPSILECNTVPKRLYYITVIYLLRVCHSQRYRQSRSLSTEWERLQSSLDSAVRESPSSDLDGRSRELRRALLTWIFIDDVKLSDARFNNFDQLPLDYLLQLLLVSNEKVGNLALTDYI
jgi:hypothetical protein